MGTAELLAELAGEYFFAEIGCALFEGLIESNEVRFVVLDRRR